MFQCAEAKNDPTAAATVPESAIPKKKHSPMTDPIICRWCFDHLFFANGSIRFLLQYVRLLYWTLFAKEAIAVRSTVVRAMLLLSRWLVRFDDL